MLCLVLAVASQSLSSNHYYNIQHVKAESTEEVVPLNDLGNQPMPQAETSMPTPEVSTSTPQPETPAPTPQPETSTPTPPPETSAPTPQPETSAPTPPPETSAPTPPPETSTPTPPPETSAPTSQPETSAPTSQPETSAPTSGSEGTEGQGNTDGSGSTESPDGTGETTPSNPDTNPETTPPETEGSGTQQTETSAETVPTETSPIEPGLAEIDLEEEPIVVPETDGESEPESEKEHITNEELIARQQIVIPPEIEKEFRFSKVEKKYAVVSNPEGTQVYEKKSDTARAVGALNYYGCCYILEDQKDGWYYIESGNVRGFVKAEEVVAGKVAERIVKIKGLKNLPPARLLVARTENAAFTYTHTTVQEVMALPEYALAAGEVNIYEQKKNSARVIGTMSDKDLCYILDKMDDQWVFVESGDARGFVEKKDLTTGQTASKAVSEAGEENMPLAEVLVKPEDNKACYYTLTSVKEAAQGAKTREAMVNFAKQFIGNPYVWGGTSLTQGADCSGFVQSIYSYFGYSLPRVAEDQSVYGMQIPIKSAEPGDLIFYARNGYVYHVSMYIGGDQVIHAAGRRVGIIISGIGGNAVWATRVIKD